MADARGATRPFGPELQVNLGLAQEAYDDILRTEGSIAVSEDPRWHSHPALGITGHLHPNDSGLHVHVPEVIWGAAVPLSSDDSEASI